MRCNVALLILQTFRHFTYFTAHSPTISLLHLRHSSFSNPSFAFPTSQALHLRHLASRPCSTVVRSRGVIDRVPDFQPDGPVRFPARPDILISILGLGVCPLSVLSLAVATLCWPHIQGGPPLCICLVFCPQSVAPPTCI